MPDVEKAKDHRSERQLRGLQSQVRGAINHSEDGAYALLDLTTAEKVCDALQQLRNYEANFETA